MANANIKKERVRAGSNATISLVGAAVILLAVNYLGMRHYTRSDWTASGIYTLSEKSIKMLNTLEAEVHLFVLWSQSDPRFPDVKELMDRYAGGTVKVKMEVLDQDLNPERFQWILDRYGAKLRDVGGGAMAVEASVIVVSGDNVKFVTSSEFEDFGGDMMGGSMGQADQEVSGYKAEQAISSAILSVTAKTQDKICFTQGHDEWAFEGFGGRGLGAIKEGLIQDGYKVAAMTTLGASRIPTDCRLVAVVGPQRAFNKDEAALLGAYLERGGRLLLLLDPIVSGTDFLPTGLESLAAKHGIGLAPNIIIEVDPRRLVGPSPLAFTASEFTSHTAVAQLVLPDSVGQEIKAQIGVYPVIFSMARSLEIKSDSDVVAEPLVKSSADSWGEVNLSSLGAGESMPAQDGEDAKGPATIAAVASLGDPGEEKKGGALVVVGDSDFLADELFVNASLNNRDFWSGLVGFLTAREDLISIAPKNPEHVHLNLTPDDVGMFWRVVIGQILFFIVLGIVAWMRRRS
ncbi:MAG: Gldg family protein [Myxococcota bacterium]|nr:Gldg family protein [Myxococcota bacterium]